MQNLDWPRLISDISEALVLTQRELGKSIGTTQQSVSNWLNGRRVPSDTKAKRFFKLADEAGISLDGYGLPNKVLKVKEKKQEIKSLPIKVRRLSYQLNDLHPRRRKKIMEYLEDMLDTVEKKHTS
jgi:transcriptional regulator with XRE-family HTH domain